MAEIHKKLRFAVKLRFRRKIPKNCDLGEISSKTRKFERKGIFFQKASNITISAYIVILVEIFRNLQKASKIAILVELALFVQKSSKTGIWRKTTEIAILAELALFGRKHRNCRILAGIAISE
jgi:hypothetical protein